VQVSGREAQVLAAVAAGQSNAEIARRLHLSVRTVEGHVSALLRKHGVTGRRELAELAPPDVPPVATIVGLPAARTTFVGRAAERAEVAAALEAAPLTTLLGPGGAGKTRLAMAVAAEVLPRFPRGGAFVDLVPVAPRFVVPAVAAALDVAESPQRPLADAVLARLRRGPFLLVLDNAEHVLDELAELVERLLAGCPDLRLLVTSRERLRVPGERTIPVGPLPLVPDAEALFRDRALAADPGHTADGATVADLCARLDGLPLAIELAAARSASLGATGLLTGLGDYLRLLAGGRGAVVRHRSLRSVLDWSVELLDADELALLGALAVFAGAFDLPAAAAIADRRPAETADLLGRLADKSLVAAAPGGWRLLATVRAYAADLPAGRDGAARERHREWAAAAAGAGTGDPAELRAALWSCPERPDPVAHGLARDLARLVFGRGFVAEARATWERAALLAPDPALAAADLALAAECAEVAHDSAGAHALLVAAADRAGSAAPALVAALARAVEIAWRYPATFPAVVARERLQALLDRARAMPAPGPAAEARLAIAEAWAAGPGPLSPDPGRAAAAVAAAGRTGDPVLLRTVATVDGDVATAHTTSARRVGLLDELPRADPSAAAEREDVLAVACYDAVGAGDLPVGLAVARRILEEDRASGEHSFLAAGKVVPVLVLTGRIAEAEALLDPMWSGWERAGCPPAVWLAAAAQYAALVAGMRGDGVAVGRWQGRAADAARFANIFHDRHGPLATFVGLRVELHRGAPADELVERAFGYPPAARFRVPAMALAAEVAVASGRADAAERVAVATAAASLHPWALACLARAAARRDPALVTAAVEAWERIDARLERAVALGMDPGRRAEADDTVRELLGTG
jgi:predicted ATPase/DNA-binding CsgD family transcriptional regulator